ncbi:SGF29 tudor-like domain-containing protein [Triangularia verruculosa]|uniref:SGF29 tudor-like domain-containing protein n=1 Tax=Triangularia verruculosa TaxID=2587418 RepID=A0AAN7AVS7_9PEZI|nr:SGF29 tudor-like domain-containing protein [Triangularia verruculosa]
MSSRNRNSRGPNRNSGSTQGEEAAIWSNIKEELRTMIEGVNNSNDELRGIIAQEKYITKSKSSKDGSSVDIGAEEAKLDALLRSSVKGADLSKQQIDSLIETVTILRALVKAKEDAEAQSAGASSLSSRERPSGLLSGGARSSSARGMGQREREREREKEREREREREKERDKDPSSLYDFDGAGDSPVPSPAGGHTRKLGGSVGGSDRSANRDSVPPRGDRDTPGKADSVPPDGGIGSGSALQRSRNVFSRLQDVVFKPKPANNSESTEWMLGKVQQVLGEGKSRRYKVQDADPDLPPDQRVEYRTSASSMIPLPQPGTDLPELEKGKTVLALYPDSTMFYKAEVMGAEASTGKVSLRFEGEENGVTLQLVDRRFVVEYRS